MKKIILIYCCIFIYGCKPQDKIKINIYKVENNIIYYTILNNTEETIEFLKPQHNYLCYETASKIYYKKYYILDFADNIKDEQLYKTTSLPDEMYPNISKTKNILISINKGIQYSDSIKIPNQNTINCIFYPVINENTILLLKKDTIMYKSNTIKSSW